MASRSGAARHSGALDDAAMQVVDDQPGQPLVVDKEALADRVRVLPGYRDRLLEDLVRPDAALDKAPDIADPVLDDLRLLPEVGLAARLAVARHDRLGVERLDVFQCREPLPGVAFLQPGAAFVKHVVAGE